MENPAEYVVIGTRMVWVLIGGSGLTAAFGVWLLARFTNTFDAYAGERAKIEAQFRNVEKLVANTEKLTAATETIKAKVTDETWDRQQRWTAKHAMYRELLESIHRLYRAQDELFSAEMDGNAGQEKRLTQARIKLVECLDAFDKLVHVSAISADSHSYGTVNRIVKSSNSGHGRVREIEQAVSDLAASARKDLGYPLL